MTAAQAFHWFDYDAARSEFVRVLQPGGHVALIWNQRDMSSPFQQAYEQLLDEFAPEYGVVNHTNIPQHRIEEFFDAGSYRSCMFRHAQSFDRTGFVGRMESSSYVPASWSRELRAAVDRLVRAYSVDGEIPFDYEAWLHLGTASAR